MIDEENTTQPDPNEADTQVAGDKAAEVDAENAEELSEVGDESGSNETTSEETSNVGENEATSTEPEVEPSASDNTALDYGQHVEVNVNGKQYSGNPLFVPTHLVNTVKDLLFHAHGVTPNE